MKFDYKNPIWICKQLDTDLKNKNSKNSISCNYILCNICYHKRERKSITSTSPKRTKNSSTKPKCNHYNHQRENLIKYTDFILFNDEDCQDYSNLTKSCSDCSRFFNTKIGLQYEQETFGCDDDSCDSDTLVAEL